MKLVLRTAALVTFFLLALACQASQDITQPSQDIFQQVPQQLVQFATTCFGETATILGTNGSEFLNGTNGPDVIVGLGGNDTIQGLDGDDLICGGAGEDDITGGPGDDRLAGQEGDDELWGREDDDQLDGGPGKDTLVGGEGDDQLVGGSGDDLYAFGTVSAAETDTVAELSAGGVDILWFGLGLAGGPVGAVSVDLTQDTPIATHDSRTINTSVAGQAANFENVTGGTENDNIIGNSADNVLNGSLGTDHILGGEGDDQLGAGGGNDTLEGGPGDDYYVFNFAQFAETITVVELSGEGRDTLDFRFITATVPVTIDLSKDAPIASHTNRTVNTGSAGQAANFEDVTGGAGNDNIKGNAGNNYLNGYSGHDQVDGLAGNDVVAGAEGQDHLFGGEGNDSLSGGPNSDQMEGGPGDDQYVFYSAPSAETDTVVELANQGIDELKFTSVLAGNPVTVNLTKDTPNALATYTNATIRTGATGQAANFEWVTGGNGNDNITGNAVANFLQGGPGNDHLVGGEGNDDLRGGNGNDNAILGGPGNDWLFGEEGDDRMEGGSGDDWYFFHTATANQTDTVVELAGEGTDLLKFLTLGPSDPVTVDLTKDTPNALATHTNRTVKTGAAGQAANFEWVQGGKGDDTITGNAAANLLFGEAGNDHMAGGEGNDDLRGGEGDDNALLGGPGNDALYGEAGNDRMEGGPGNDVYAFLTAASSETDTVVELAGEGTDWFDFGNLAAGDPVTVDLTKDMSIAAHTNRVVNTGMAGQAAFFENARGGEGNDTLKGNAAANRLEGYLGNDILTGGEGDDVLRGEKGNDTYVFGPALSPQTDAVVELPGEGTDHLDFSGLSSGDGVTVDLTIANPLAQHTNRTVKASDPGLEALVGLEANFENVTGGAGNDNITGNAAANTLKGLAGNDTLTGGEFDDLLIGGVGDDTYGFGPASAAQTDTVEELAGEGTDKLDFSALGSGSPVTVDLASDSSLATHSNRTVKTAASGQAANFENATGGAGADTLKGNAGANTLDGGPAGNDTLEGKDGNDTLLGGAGSNDTLIGGEGNDFMAGGPGDDTYVFGTASANQTDTVEELAGQGTDLLDFSGLVSGDPVTVDLTKDNPLASHTKRTVKTNGSGQAANFENITGGGAGDTLYGNAANNLIKGGPVKDIIAGREGNDELLGEGGNDDLYGGAGTDIGNGGAGAQDRCADDVETKISCELRIVGIL